MYVVGAKKRPRNENDTIWLEMEQFNFVSFLNEKSLEKCDFFTKLRKHFLLKSYEVIHFTIQKLDFMRRGPKMTPLRSMSQRHRETC